MKVTLSNIEYQKKKNYKKNNQKKKKIFIKIKK